MYYVPCNTKVLLVLKCLFKFQINISLVYDIGWQLMEGLFSLKFTSRFIISSFMGQKSERYISPGGGVLPYSSRSEAEGLA